MAGTASIEAAVAISETTTFNVGSVGKQITAHLIVLAARQRLLRLDQLVADLLPRFRIPDVTVGDLLLHHGGVRDAESMLSLAGFRDLDHYTADDLLELTYRQTRRALPTGRFLYSNTGYLLLAKILQTVHGTSLPELARQQIFTPLGMTSARFKSDPREVIPGAASSYRAVPAGWEHCVRPVSLPGPGSLWCTVADLGRWLDHLQQEWSRTPRRLLPFEHDLPYRPSDHRPCLYGVGLYADPRPGHMAVFHYGHEQGFSAATRLSRQGLRIICLSNHATVAADHVAATVLTAFRKDSHQDLGTILAQAADTYLSPQAASTSLSAAPGGDKDDNEPHTMLGTFTCDQVPGTLRLSRSNGWLYLWRRGTRERLVQTGPLRYTADGYTLTLDASPDGDEHEALHRFSLDLERAPGLVYRSR